MRYAFVLGAILGMASPGVATGQNLGPRTLLPIHVACAQQPVTTLPSPPLTIGGAQRADGREVLGTGDIVVIPGGTSRGVDVGQSFLARRVSGNSTTAYRRGVMGFAGVTTSGIITVIAADHRNALARVDRVCSEVRVGDFLEPAALPAVPAAADAGDPDFDDRASILFGNDMRREFGDGDMVSIDRGANQGVTPGTRFALYRDPHSMIGLPLSELGEAVVVEVGETASRAVIVKVTDVVSAGDVAVRRRPAQP